MCSKAMIGRHPLHPMLIAFPVASYLGTLIGFAVYIANGHVFWLNLGIALTTVGAGSSLLAALPGIVDWALGIPKASEAKVVGAVHAVLNVSAVGLVAAIAYSYFPDFNGPLADGTLGLALAASAVALTLAAGALGWTLVQTYHVGVRLTAAQVAEEQAVQEHSVLPLSRKGSVPTRDRQGTLRRMTS
jgi:uncharacterized membrane protein